MAQSPLLLLEQSPLLAPLFSLPFLSSAYFFQPWEFFFIVANPFLKRIKSYYFAQQEVIKPGNSLSPNDCWNG